MIPVTADGTAYASLRGLLPPRITCETGCGHVLSGRHGESYAQAWASAQLAGWFTDGMGRRVAPRCAWAWLRAQGRGVFAGAAALALEAPRPPAPWLETAAGPALSQRWVAPKDPEDRPDLPEPTEVYRWRPDYWPSPEPPAADATDAADATEAIDPVDPADYLGALPPADDALGHRKPRRRHWWQRGTA